MRLGKMRPGIRALFEVARRDWRKAQPFDMGFALGPRINAAGRLDDMSVGIACLLARDDAEAQELAGSVKITLISTPRNRAVYAARRVE